jgi:octaprenyl-diphosphate synthase
MSDDSSLRAAASSGLDPRGQTRGQRRLGRAGRSPGCSFDVLDPLRRATAASDLGNLTRRLEDAHAMLGGDLAQLEADIGVLIAEATATPDRARHAAAHLLGRPGKRIRPLCVMLGAELAELAIDDAVRDLALASELVHAATLLHDDVIDEGTERRGAATARLVYGNTASILGGDYLLVEALVRVARVEAESATPGLLPSLLQTIAEMVAAEALQLEQRESFVPSSDTYFDIIDGKTASLFRWALTAPARLGRLPEPQRQALADAGTALGLAFQLADDALDLEGDPRTTGKDLLSDLRQGKLTWPLLVAVEHDPTLALEIVRQNDQARRGEVDAGDTADLTARIIASGAVDATRELARHEAARARRALLLLPEGRARTALELVATAAAERSR